VRQKDLAQLPTSVGALYEISQILKLGEDTMKVCLQFTASRKSTAELKHEWATKKPALIQPKVTELALRTWRRKWENPPPPKQKRTDKRTLPFITITCNGELFDFDRKTGDKVGCVDLVDVEEFLKEVEELARSKNRSIQFRIDNQMDYLTQGYFKRKESYDITRNLNGGKKAEEKYV
jgi:hypothetical protein